MKIMLFLILVSLLLAAGFLLAYLRAARAGQFDDEFTPAVRILFDEALPEKTEPLGITPSTDHKTQQDEDLKASL